MQSSDKKMQGERSFNLGLLPSFCLKGKGVLPKYTQQGCVFSFLPEILNLEADFCSGQTENTVQCLAIQCCQRLSWMEVKP